MLTAHCSLLTALW
jgi:hypothetical protein